MSVNRLLCAIFLVLGAMQARSQDEGLLDGYDEGTDLNVLYRSDKSVKIYASTWGYGLLYRKAKHVTAKTRSFYEIDFQTLKHPKESRTKGDASTRRTYVYGKLNSTFVLRGGLGKQNVIFGKADLRSVEVRYSYSLGPVLAFAKPYYVQIYKGAGSQKPELIRFDDEYFLADTPIVTGRGAYSDGLAEMKVYPGISGKFNLSFEYAPYTNLIRAIETGISVDYYPKALPMMARNQAENIVVALHVGFVIGRKKY